VWTKLDIDVLIT